MSALAGKRDIIQQLQKDVLSMQGYKRSLGSSCISGLGPIEDAFPDKTFQTGAVHELISHVPEDAAATNGFIAGVLGRLMQKDSACLWISTKRTLFPPALKVFGIEPDQIIFVDVAQPREALWAMEEALKCDAITAVVGEISELSFTQSRRMQLAVEESRVTGFIHRYNPRSENTVACVTKWKIKPLPSVLEDGMPGVGFPRWNVQLLKVRNGRPGDWQIEWTAGRYQDVGKPVYVMPEVPSRRAG